MRISSLIVLSLSLAAGAIPVDGEQSPTSSVTSSAGPSATSSVTSVTTSIGDSNPTNGPTANGGSNATTSEPASTLDASTSAPGNSSFDTSFAAAEIECTEGDNSTGTEPPGFYSTEIDGAYSEFTNGYDTFQTFYNALWELYFKLCCAAANCYINGGATFSPRLYWPGGSRYNATAEDNYWSITAQIVDTHNPTTDSFTDSPGAGKKCWNEQLMPALSKQFNLQKPIVCQAAPPQADNGTVASDTTSGSATNGTDSSTNGITAAN